MLVRELASVSAGSWPESTKLCATAKLRPWRTNQEAVLLAKQQGARLRTRQPNVDRLAIWAVVLGILSLILFVFCLGFVLGPVAVIIGFVSLEKVLHSEGSIRGGATAVAGMVLGVAGLIASIAWWIHIQSVGNGAMFCVGPGGNLC
jgi:Domain of unknown function (DUF4190)